MKKIALVILTLSLFACSFNAKVPQSGLSYLQGTWAEDSIENQQQLVNYEKYYLRFTCDSFYLNIKSYSKINLQGGKCYNNTTWEEYAKGIYTSSNDTLFLKGAFVSENYRFKPQTACYRFGNYQESFVIQKVDSTSLLLHNTISKQKHRIVIKQKGSCNSISN